MIEEREAASKDTLNNAQKLQGGIQINKQAFITILVCTGLSLLFSNTGLLSLIYLAPLGYAVVVSGYLFFTFFFVMIANFVLFISMSFLYQGSLNNIWVFILYITVMFIGFIWIMGGKSIRTAYRFILASAAGALAFMLLLYSPNSSIYEFFKSTAEDIYVNFFLTHDVSVNPEAAAENMIVFEGLLESMKNIIFRGGAVFTMFIIFYINRFLALTAVWLIKKEKTDRGLMVFFAPPKTFWLFAASLGSIFLTRLLRLEILEIISWNGLIVCSIIFMAQGTGILMYWFTRITPGYKLLIGILVVFIVLSPFSIIAVAALLLLGITENWVPYRALKEKPAQTGG
jgi:hypothetical protein